MCLWLITDHTSQGSKFPPTNKDVGLLIDQKTQPAVWCEFLKPEGRMTSARPEPTLVPSHCSEHCSAAIPGVDPDDEKRKVTDVIPNFDDERRPTRKDFDF